MCARRWQQRLSSCHPAGTIPGEVSRGAAAASAVTQYHSVHCLTSAALGLPPSQHRATHRQGSGRKRTSRRRWSTLRASVGRAHRWPRPGLTTQSPAAAPQGQSSTVPVQVGEAACCWTGSMPPGTCSMLQDATGHTCPSAAAQGQSATLLSWILQALPCQDSSGVSPSLDYQPGGPWVCLGWTGVLRSSRCTSAAGHVQAPSSVTVTPPQCGLAWSTFSVSWQPCALRFW